MLGTWRREHFDYLVNNAGNSLHVGFEQMTEAQFDEVVNVHFKGVYFLTQKLLRVMNDGGRIVNISSGLTRFSFPGSSAYAAAKGAVGSDPLPGQGTRTACDHRKCGRAGRDSNRF
jgi:NAD(P)-dependent dehydrogenase (short-subunit alcohol dehydrogenase family)